MSATTSAATFQTLHPGSSFGSYDVLRCIGIGGMGAVFEANHRMLDRRVALKVMHGESREGFDLRARFLREGAALVRVKHPNVVTVYDAGVVEGMPYLAMELLEGTALDRLIAREGPLAPERAVALLAPIADGLAAVHEAGLIHRDVKPENLFVTTDAAGLDVVKLIDFGIAKESANTGARNTVVGTPHYMPPEQLFGGEPLDGRADQYSLAVVLYEALTSALPYDGASVLDLAMKVEAGGAQPPSLRIGGGIPTALDVVVLRALARHAHDRFPTMGEFHRALLESVPFSMNARRSSSTSLSAELDVSAELRHSRELPTMVAPLAATQAMTRPLGPAKGTPSPASEPAPAPAPKESGARPRTIAFVLALSFVLSIALGLGLASRARRAATTPDAAATSPRVEIPVVPPPAPTSTPTPAAPAHAGAQDRAAVAAPSTTPASSVSERTEPATQGAASPRRAPRAPSPATPAAGSGAAGSDPIRLMR